MMTALENRLQLEGYTIGDEIGRGTLSIVYSAKSTSTKWTYAAKKLVTKDPPIDDISVLTHLKKHPNIMEFKCKLGMDGEAQTLFVISEFCPLGNIGDYILKQQVDIVTKRKLAVQLADAIAFLHANRIIHCDIKPQNALLTGNETSLVLKVVDFGLTKVLTGSEKIGNNFGRSFMQSNVETRFYLSPEIYQGLLNDQPCRYTSSVDIFSLGLLLWAMFDGLSVPGTRQEDRYLTPFTGAETDPMPIAQAVTQRNTELNNDVIKTEKNLRCKNVVRSMLSSVPNDRPSAQNVLETLIQGYGDYRVEKGVVCVEVDDEVNPGSSCSCKRVLWCIGCTLCYLDKKENCAKCWKGKGILFMLLTFVYSLIAMVLLPLWAMLVIGIFLAFCWLVLNKGKGDGDCLSSALAPVFSMGKPCTQWWSSSPDDVYKACPRVCCCFSAQSGCCRFDPKDGPDCCCV